MDKVKLAAELAPVVRISLFIFSGWLSQQGYDSTIVQYVRTSPEVAATVVGGITALWYAAAKYFNWTR